MKVKDFSHMKDIALAELYDRIMRSEEGLDLNDPAVSGFRVSVPRRLLSKAINALNSNGLIEAGEDGYTMEISTSGIKYVEEEIEDNPFSNVSMYLYKSGPDEVENWNTVDITPSISPEPLEQIKVHVGECLKLITTSDFSQEEQAQIHGLLHICEQLIELPTPKFSLAKKILGWLSTVKDITELVEKIKALLPDG